MLQKEGGSKMSDGLLALVGLVSAVHKGPARIATGAGINREIVFASRRVAGVGFYDWPVRLFVETRLGRQAIDFQIDSRRVANRIAAGIGGRNRKDCVRCRADQQASVILQTSAINHGIAHVHRARRLRRRRLVRRMVVFRFTAVVIVDHADGVVCPVQQSAVVSRDRTAHFTKIETGVHDRAIPQRAFISLVIGRYPVAKLVSRDTLQIVTTSGTGANIVEPCRIVVETDVPFKNTTGRISRGPVPPGGVGDNSVIDPTAPGGYGHRILAVFNTVADLGYATWLAGYAGCAHIDQLELCSLCVPGRRGIIDDRSKPIRAGWIAAQKTGVGVVYMVIYRVATPGLTGILKSHRRRRDDQDQDNCQTQREYLLGHD